MTLVAEVAGSLDGWLRQFGYLEETALGVFAWSDMERQVEALIAALAARGIDLELAYQWQRVDKAATTHDFAVSVGRDGPGYVARAYDRMGEMQKDGWSEEYDEEFGFGKKGVPATPAAALAALADALEERE